MRIATRIQRLAERPWATAAVRALLALALVVAFTAAILPVRDDQILGSDKAMHAFAFAVLALLCDLAFPKVRMVALFIALSAFGGLIELVQGLPLVGRDCDVFDWLVDMAAIAAALPLARYSRNFLWDKIRSH